MKNFFWIFTHYFKKNILTPLNLILIGLPLIFIFALELLSEFLYLNINTEFAGLSSAIIAIKLGFQFFGADLTTDWLHHDLKGPTRSRLMVSGIDQRIFFLAVIIAGWVANIFYSSLLIAIVPLLFDVVWGNYLFLTLALLFLSFMTQLCGVLIFICTKDEKSGSRMAYLFGEVMIITAILPQLVGMEGSIANILNYLPIQLGVQLSHSTSISEALPYVGILLCLNLILTGLVFFIGRSKAANDRF